MTALRLMKTVQNGGKTRKASGGIVKKAGKTGPLGKTDLDGSFFTEP